MSEFRYISQTYIESPEFKDASDGLTYRINLTDGQDVLFISEKEFFTPRRVATNLPEVVKLENVVKYAPNNVPIIKLQNGQIPLTTPQYYLNSIVKDVYRQYRLDKFFTELDDELAVPEYVGTTLERRQLALTTLLNLEDLAAAALINDAEGITEAVNDIDNNFSELAGLETIAVLRPEELTTPEEDDQLATLDFIGLTSNEGASLPGGFSAGTAPGPIPGTVTSGGMNDVSPGNTKIVLPDGTVVVAPGDFVGSLTPEEKEELGIPDYPLPEEGSLIPNEDGIFSSEDTSADIIDPVPTVDESSLIRLNGELPIVAGQIPGIDTVNEAIKLLNTGVQQIEGSLQGSMEESNSESNNCKTITIAKGKKGFGVGKLRLGKKPERNVSRDDLERRLAQVKTDIALQEKTETPILKNNSGVPTLVKTSRVASFSSFMGIIAKMGALSSISKSVGAPIAITATTSAVPAGYQPMTKTQILDLLNRVKQEIEKLLAEGC